MSSATGEAKSLLRKIRKLAGAMIVRRSGIEPNIESAVKFCGLKMLMEDGGGAVFGFSFTTSRDQVQRTISS